MELCGLEPSQYPNNNLKNYTLQMPSSKQSLLSLTSSQQSVSLVSTSYYIKIFLIYVTVKAPISMTNDYFVSFLGFFLYSIFLLHSYKK